MDIEDIFKEIQYYTKEGNRRALSRLLRTILPDRLRYYHECRQLTRLDAYVDMLYKSLLLELDEEEEDSIEMAELAYVGITEELLRTRERYYENLRQRISLLHYFADYFTDSLIEIFLKEFRENNLLEARNLALESLARMQLADIFYLEQHFDERIDRDEQLNDICNEIEIAPNLSDKELTEAELMHKVLYAYLKTKYKKRGIV